MKVFDPSKPEEKPEVPEEKPEPPVTEPEGPTEKPGETETPEENEEQ